MNLNDAAECQKNNTNVKVINEIVKYLYKTKDMEDLFNNLSGPGSILGGISLLSNKQKFYSVKVTSNNCCCYRISQKEIFELFKKDENFEILFCKKIVEEEAKFFHQLSRIGANEVTLTQKNS